MKYMMLFWVDESAETTADEDAAIMVAVKSWVDQMTERGILVHGGALHSAGEAAIVLLGRALGSLTALSAVSGVRTPETAYKSPGPPGRSERAGI
jgi:hypothetical protein